MSRNATLAAVLLLAATSSFAFKLKFGDPLPEVRETAWTWASRTLISKVGDPVHEGLLRETLACAPDGSDCPTGLEGRGISYASLLRGVRWPDNPAFYVHVTPTGKLPDFCLSKGSRLVTLKPGGTSALPPDKTLVCWAITMGASQRAAREVDPRYKNHRRNSSFTLPLRSHYADMQFFHGMAPYGQAAGDSYGLMRAWAKLTYEVAAGVHTNWTLVRHIVDDDPQMAPLRNYFNPTWEVWKLFDFSNPESQDARGIALGALLHMLQDSYAKCHTERRLVNGAVRVERYLTFDGQDANKHASGDVAYVQVGDDPGPIGHGRRIVEALKAGSKDFADIAGTIEAALSPRDPRQQSNAGGHDCAITPTSPP